LETGGSPGFIARLIAATNSESRMALPTSMPFEWSAAAFAIPSRSFRDRHGRFSFSRSHSQPFLPVHKFTPVLVNRLGVTEAGQALKLFQARSALFLKRGDDFAVAFILKYLLLKLLLGGNAPGFLFFPLQKCRHRDQQAKHQQDHDFGHGQAEDQALAGTTSVAAAISVRPWAELLACQGLSVATCRVRVALEWGVSAGMYFLQELVDGNNDALGRARH